MFRLGKKEEVAEYLGSVVIVIGGRLELIPIDKISDGTVQAGDLVLPLVSGVEYFSGTGDRYLVYNLDVPALTEAQFVRGLRQSEVFKGMFEVQEPKRFMDYLPMLIVGFIAALVVFIRK